MPSKSRAVARLLSQTRDENIATDRYDRPRPARRSHDADSDSTRTLGAGTASIKGVGMLPKEDEMDRSSVGTAELEDQKGVAEEGVSQAIEALAKMERRLRRAVKRQKIKIEESTIPAPIPAPEDPPNRRASRPRLVKSKQKSIGEAVQEHLPTPERDVQDSEYEDDGAAPTKKAEEDTIEVAERGAARPPPINSQYLPLPWQGRLGYACLNTYLRNAKQPVFCSRTCRMASIIDHRHPLQDPSQPEHPTKNRPDRTKKAVVALGQTYVQGLGLTNARDIPKMLRWNERYGIRFMRLSSEMFPFASHPEHGYKLAPFASDVLAEAGRVAAELGHRLTVHPGQFTQLGSPRKEVVDAAVRDLEYHDEMLTLLRLPPQQNRDAVMILHMGGVFGDKAATVARFKDNYTRRLTPSMKARLVLENDDVGWSVHDLLPVCEDLDIPLVLDYHHHNIIFNPEHVREGTMDISAPELMARITATWTRKNITQKMHYSEPCAGAVTPRDRRKHSPRVATLPPCPPTMDLMIEAKDKEQAVFELMRTFKLPGFELINDVVPHEREDESREPVKRKNPRKSGKRRGKKEASQEEADTDGGDFQVITEGKNMSEEDRSMGGPLRRVYWPAGLEDWLKPRKRDSIITKRKGDDLDAES